MSESNDQPQNRALGVFQNRDALLPIAQPQLPILQPRQPHNLQGLLRYAMDASIAEETVRITDAPLDEERRRFLEEALRSLTVDVARVLQESTRVLSDAELVGAVGSADQVPEDIDTALNNIMDFVDDIDIANDFYKIGGYSVFPVLLSAQCDPLRARACELLAVVCQNNPFTQARALESGLLNILINMAENEQAANVVAMTTYALSCTMREFEPSCKEFIAQNGCRVLLRLLNYDNVQVRTKAAFLIRYFCKHYPDAQAQLLEHNVVSDLAKLLIGERNSASEHILSTLVVLSESSQALEQMLNPENKLKEIIEKYVVAADLKEGTEYIEEKEYCEELLKIVKNVRECDDSVER